MSEPMTVPDPQTVREIAAKVANIALHDSVHVDQWISAVIDSDFGNECSQVRAPLHAAVARRMATVRPSWPHEQQPADVVTAEQQQDGAAEAVQRFADAWRDTDKRWSRTSTYLTADGTEGGTACMTEPQLRAVLAERDALAARIAELESERDDDLCVLAAFLLPNRRPIEEWLCILANHFEARTNALMWDADRFAAARFRVDRVPGALDADTDGCAQ